MQENRLSQLFERYLNGTSTERENIELATYILAPEHADALERLKEAHWEKVEGAPLTEAEAESQLRRILQSFRKGVRVVSWQRWAVAASILLVVSLGGYFLLRDRKTQPEAITNAPETHDVKAPETNRAMITLADGRTVALDSLNSGLLAQQANVTVTKTADGKIVYSGQTSELIYNTLYNPRDSKVIDMALADGSHVWLNAGSSVTYPIAFAGADRKVSITGEAYFEVAHDATKPFYVQKGDMQVQVLGTHFNVNAYDDEDAIRITLLEGSVRVSSQQNSLTIQPNQQAVVTMNNSISLNDKVNVAEVLAWKNGLFKFGKASIEDVMKQVARWYDVEVIYESRPVEHFRGEIGRTVEVSKVLKMLEETEAVHFRIEGRKIYVVK